MNSFFDHYTPGTKTHWKGHIDTKSDRRWYQKVQTFMDQSQLIYLSIDLDAFDGAFAPGVSTPAATGLSPALLIPFLKAIVQSEKLALVDIRELNPQYDQDNRTAKLGANLLFRIVDAIMNKS